MKKKKSTPTKNESMIQKYPCPCIGFFLLNLKNRQQIKRSKISKNETLKPEETLKSRHEASQTEEILESSHDAAKSKCIRKAHIIRLPKKRCHVPLLIKLFTNLSDIGAIHMDEREIMNAVNTTVQVKKDLDAGKPWNGNIEIAENLKLKLYKSGLILYNKK